VQQGRKSEGSRAHREASKSRIKGEPKVGGAEVVVEGDQHRLGVVKCEHVRRDSIWGERG
jgi:hypothetical protein